MLDAQHRVIGREELFAGDADADERLPTREVVKCVLRHNAGGGDSGA